MHMKPNRSVGVWSGGRFTAEPYKEDRWLMTPQILNSPKSFSKTFLKARWGEGVAGCCKCLGIRILCSYGCPWRSVTIFLQTSSKTTVLPLFFFFHCSGFCHTLTWISLGYTCIPHPDPPSHLPLHPIPLGLPSAPGPSTWFMHPTWAGNLPLFISIWMEKCYRYNT